MLNSTSDRFTVFVEVLLAPCTIDGILLLELSFIGQARAYKRQYWATQLKYLNTKFYD
jgi:hypothetical protein